MHRHHAVQTWPRLPSSNTPTLRPRCAKPSGTVRWLRKLTLGQSPLVRSLASQSFTSLTRLEEESTEWLDVLDPSVPICHGSQRILRIMKACTRAKEVLRLVPTQGPTEDLFTCLLASVEDLKRLEDSLRYWNQSIPRSWQLSYGEPLSGAESCGSSPTFSHDIFVAHYWNYQRLFHIVLHETLASCWLFLSDQFLTGERIDYMTKFSRSR